MLRTIAASIMACGVCGAASTSAHAQHFNALSGLRGRATPSSGVIMISPEGPHGLACTGAYTPKPIEYAESDGTWGSGSSVIDGSLLFYSQIGVGARFEWPNFIPDKLRPILQNVNFNWPTPQDIGSAAYDLENAYYQGLRSAGCEAEKVAMTPLAADRSATPEPATWALLILGVAMIGLAARRRERLNLQPSCSRSDCREA